MRKIRGILSLLISAMTVLGLCAPLTALGAEVNGPVPTADVDQTDEAQFGQANYQLNEFDGGYLKKTFRWTDKENGLGQVILEMELDEAPKTTAVYAFTSCAAHGFTKELAERNIRWLISNYDYVDLIWPTEKRTSALNTWATYETTYKDIHITLHIGENGVAVDRDGNSIPDYKDIFDGNTHYFNYLNAQYPGTIEQDHGIYWGDTAIGESKYLQGAHFGASLYTGLYKYLMGMTDADSIDASYTGTADTQKRFPTAIYLSFDLKATSINSGTTNGITDIVSFDCWSILRTYKEQGRYYSSGLDATGTYPYLGYDNQHWNSFDTAQKVRQCFVFNEIIGLMNPTYMNDVNGDGSADLQDILVISQQHKLWNGDNVVYKNQEDFRYYEEYVSDYRYNQTFAAQDAPTIIPVTLVDTISDNFVIAPTDPLSWSSVDTGGSDTTNSGTKLTPTVDYGSNTVNIQYNKYHDGDTVTITVDVILKDDPEKVTWNDWFDANDGDAVLTVEQNGETATETVSSPIAHVEEASFTATKIWDDGGDRDGIRPDSVTFDLYQTLDGTETKLDGVAPVWEKDGDTWTATWRHLPAYTYGADNEIQSSYTYRAEESAIPGGYTVTQDGDTVTNFHLPSTVDVAVTKVWNDFGHEDERPESVTVTLTADGEVTEQTLTLTAEGDWQGQFLNLPTAAEDGHIIAYAVEETEMTGYRSAVEQAIPSPSPTRLSPRSRWRRSGRTKTTQTASAPTA